MTDGPSFTAAVYQNKYLPAGGTEVDAVITVTAAPDQGQTAENEAAAVAVVILLDRSDSMGHPMAKFTEAQRAAREAVDQLRDGALFAIVAGSGRADMAYPRTATLVPANPETRRAAHQAIGGLRPGGGTAIGQWLTQARELFATAPGAIGQAILLTDGRNESETAAALAAVLRACAGAFGCECRGVGTGWDVAELTGIARALLGTADAVREPADLAADFRSIIDAAMAKTARDVGLRVWTPSEGVLQFIRQVSPAVESLAPRPGAAAAAPGQPTSREYPTGAWGAGTRDYHLRVSVPAARVGEERLAARVNLVVDGSVVSTALVLAVGTDDVAQATIINERVAHYTGQAELAAAIRRGVAARRAGDQTAATHNLGQAVALAAAAGHDATLALLREVVEIADALSGTVRLRADVDPVGEKLLEVRATTTVRPDRRPPAP